MNQKTKPKLPVGRTLSVIAIAAILGVIVYRDLTDATPVQAVDVTHGPMTAYVEERAQTSLPRIYHITMPIQGRLLPLAVTEGDGVTNGQVVARVEEKDWVDATEQVSQMVRAMDSALQAATAQIKANEARTDFTKWVRDANEGAQGDAISERDKRTARWEHLDAVVKTEESTANYHAMSAFYAMTKLMEPYARRNLERTAIVSPVSGVILKRHVWNETVLSAGTRILELGDLNDLEVTAEILTDEAVGITEGDRVEIFGEAVGDDGLPGTVRRIEPEAFTKLSSLGVEQQRVNVLISFDPKALDAYRDSGRTLGLHYRVRTRIITDSRPDTVLVPRTALFRGHDGTWETYRVDGNRATRVGVDVGLSNDTQAEILKGLHPGDRVINAPESAIADGVRVVVE